MLTSPIVERLLRVVLAAQEPDLLRLAQADRLGQQRGAEAAVEGADARAGLAEARVVGGDREVADEVQDLAAADRVAGDHRDDRLRQPAHLHVQVGDVEAPDRRALGHVAGVAAHALVAAGAERQRALAGEDDRADLRVLAGELQRLRDLHDRLRAEGVADLGAVDRDLRDPVAGGLVADVLEIGLRVVHCMAGHHTSGMPIDPWLPRAAALRPDRIALEAPEGALTYAQLLDGARGSTSRPAAASRSRCRRGCDFAVALHACLLARAAAMPVDPRLGEAEQAALLASADLVIDGPRQTASSTRAEHDRRRGTDDVALVVHTSGHDRGAAPGRAELRQHPGQRARVGGRARPRPRRALAVPAAALARRRADGAAALGDLRHARRARRRRARHARRRHGRLARPDPAAAAARRRRAPRRAPARRAAGRRRGDARPARCARARPAGRSRATYGLTQACSQVAVDGAPRCPGLAVTLAPDGEILVEGPTVAGGGVLRTGDLGRFDDAGPPGGRSAARPTRSSPAARTSRPPRSRPRCSRTRPSRTPACSAARTRSGGRRSTASVVLRAPADPQELREWVAGRLARFKVPKAVEVADALPRTAIWEAAAPGAAMSDDIRQQSRARWTATAKGWGIRADQLRRATMPVAELDGRRARARSPATRCSSWPPAPATPASSPPS